MPRKAVLALSLVLSKCLVAEPIAAKVFGLPLPQSLLLRAHEVLQSLNEGIFA
jgi:hypothetical protein